MTGPTRPAATGEPRTEAGRRLWADPDIITYEDGLAAILAIEAEAAAIDVERLTAALWGMHFSNFEASSMAKKIAAAYAAIPPEELR